MEESNEREESIDFESSLNYDLISGRFLISHIPEIKSKIIRIYLCAPFSDMFDECSQLYTQVFPKLREFCMYRYGMEFQVVNLNWDVDIKDKQSLLERSLAEIEKCKRDSNGVSFLALIGDEYGTAVLPSTFDRQVFLNILKCLRENKIDPELLEKYYKLNINFLANIFELQSDSNLTSEVESKLNSLLVQGAQLAIEKGLIERSILDELGQSMLQKLMAKAAFNKEPKANKMFSYIRIQPVNLSANPFPDKTNTLDYLRDREINYYFPVEQIYRIRVSRADAQYLRNFGQHYENLFKSLVDKYIQQTKSTSGDEHLEKHHTHVLYHLNHIKFMRLNEMPQSLVGLAKKLSDYVLDGTQRQPFILTGPTGCGKSSLMATFASNLFLQLSTSEGFVSNNRHVMLVRFIGIDAESVYLRTLLRSLCFQLQYIRNNKNKKNNLKIDECIPRKLSELKAHFRKLLNNTFTVNRETGEEEEEEEEDDRVETPIKLIIILDSLQDLSRSDQSYKLDWLPKYLHPNVKLILTVSSDCTELIQRLSRKFTNSKNYAELSLMNEEQSEYLVRKLLTNNKKRLEPAQLELVVDVLKKRKLVLPLHLKLLAENFLSWKSYTPLDECIVKDTLDDAIWSLFTELEKKHGYLLVKHALSYLTISPTGLSELELQDVLSLDNELLKSFKSKDMLKPLNSAGANHLVLRMPWFYITPLLNSLQNYLLKRPFHNLYTLSWRHQAFHRVVHNKYLLEDKTYVVYLHKTLSNYYMGKWSGGRLKSLSYEKVLQKGYDPKKPDELVFDKPIIKTIKIHADRQSPSQPIQYEDFHVYLKPRYNLRKLKQLPYHLIHANMIKELFDHVFFNIEWIYAKINAFDLATTLYDYDSFKEDDLEVRLVGQCLKISEAAILEDVNFIFNELSGRLLPYYSSYDKIRQLVDQCDRKIAQLNPLLPIGHIFNSPYWINEETIDIGINLNENTQLDLLESQFNGRMLISKALQSTMVKFFDLDLLEPMSDIFTGKGNVYCSKNGEFVCTIEEDNTRFIIRQIQNGEFYANVALNTETQLTYELGHVYLSSNYATIIFRKRPSPLLIDLKQGKMIKEFPYQTSFSSISPDDKVLLIHSEKHISYFLLNNLEHRAISLDSSEVPELATFARNNSLLFVLTRDTKEVCVYDIILEKRFYQKSNLIQDKHIVELKVSPDESMLLVCSLYSIYVFDLTSEKKIMKFKIDTNQIDSYVNYLSSNSENSFTGYGCTLDNQTIFCTYYTYLACFDSQTGQLIRLFQSTLAANRIVKSLPSKIADTLVSVLDNHQILIWNLSCVNFDRIKFECMNTFHDAITNCLIPKVSHTGSSSSLIMTYSQTYPDAKVHNLKLNCSTQSLISSSYLAEKMDNMLTSQIKLIAMDDIGRYCFMVNDFDEFDGKKLPEEANFVKRICSLIDLSDQNRVIERISFVIKKNGRFEVDARFFTVPASKKTYLLIKQVSCINDLDPFSKSNLDWTDFETVMKLYECTPFKLILYDEFKLDGEMMCPYGLTSDYSIFTSLLQECQKLYDKEQPSVIKAKRYDVYLAVYELFESKIKSLKVQRFSLNELLSLEDHAQNPGRSVFLDMRVTYNDKLLLVYSKDGAKRAVKEPKSARNKPINSNPNTYEYNYAKFKFERDIRTEKGAILYDPYKNEVLRRFSSIFCKETNVEQLILSDGNGFACDNNLDLYDILNTGKLVRNIEKNNHRNLCLSIEHAKFLFKGRYIITIGCLDQTHETEDSLMDKVYLVRCYDSLVVASLKLKSKPTCLRVGEEDRTIVIGTEDGNVLSLKLLIDLEKQEAIDNYIKFYREDKSIKQSTSSLSNYEASYLTMSEYSMADMTKSSRAVMLENDLKRVVHSATAHRQLKHRESSAFISPSVVSLEKSGRCSSASTFDNKSSSFADLNNNNIGMKDFHGGVAKRNLSTISMGIKHSSSNSRACLIQ